MNPKLIIFSPDMAQAIWDRRKSQTRRLAWRKGFDKEHPSAWQRIEKGLLLIVREAYAESTIHGHNTVRGVAVEQEADCIRYRGASPDLVPFVKWTPAIHMPTKVSRSTLVVTSRKIEKLKSISHDDALAEGFSCVGEFNDKFIDLHGNRIFDANPDVVAISFEAHRANINDFILALGAKAA